MRCRNVRKNLVAYLDGEISGRRLERVRAHLRSCTACAGELDACARLRSALASLEPPAGQGALSAADILRTAARDRIRTRPPRGLPAWGARAWRPALILGTTLLALILLRGGPGFERYAVPSLEEIVVAERIELFENLDLIETLPILEWMAAPEDGGGEAG